MALTQVTGPYPIFTDLDGTPLDDGYLYIGSTNQDPETNPIQVYWDSDLTIPATQPIRTNNGYAWRNGTPALIYTGGEFSITIRNKRQEFVLYSPVGYGFDPSSVSASVTKNDFIGDGVEVDFTISATPTTVLATNVFINGVYQEKDSYSILGNVVTFSIAPPVGSSIEILTSQSGIINSGSATDISYALTAPGAITQTVQTKLDQYASVKDFGAVGDGVTDDTAAIEAALNAAYTIDFGDASDVYIVSSSSVSDIILEITTPGSRTIIGNGATIKIKDGSLEYKAIMGSDDSTLDLGDFSVSGLVFDCNKANMTYTVAGNQLTNFCGGVKARKARTINIENNTVIGPVSRQFFFFPGVTTVGGVDAYSIDYVNVSNNTFLSVGKAGLAYFDSSLIYINCRMGVVNNNYGIGETMGVNGAVTFIEMHNQNMTVTGNYVDNYQSLAVISGITLEDTERSLVSGNVAHVYRNGIVMFATQYLSHTTGYGIRGILISDNYISVQQSACPAGLSLGYGIGFQSGSNLPNADISIKNNFVEYEIENSAQAYTFLPFGALGATESAATSSFERLEISGNTIINSLCPAVQLGSNGGVFKDCYIGTNYIINPGQSQYAGMGTSSRSGVLIQAEELQGFLTIDKQFISDTFATTRMIYGMTFDVDTLSTSVPVTAAADIKITGSTTTAFVAPVRLNDTNSIPQFDVTLNMAPPTFGTRAWKAGSKLFDTVNNISYTNTADGTTFISTGYAAAAPLSGTYTVGSIRYNTAPTAGGYLGWICTTAGTPGTWKTFGAISV